MKRIKRFLPLVLGLAILTAIALLAPWAKVLPLLAKIEPEPLAIMSVLAVTYYSAKAVRFWVMLRLLGIVKPLPRVALIYMAAQPASVLPAGELFRTVLLEKKLDVPMKESTPTVTLQGLIEAVILLSFSLIGALILGRDRLAVIGVAIVLVLFLYSIKSGWLSGGERFLNKLPFLEISKSKYNRFLKDHQKLLSRKPLAIIGAMSIVPVLAGILIFYTAAHAVNADISLSGASIGYSLPVVLSGISFLPGGLGASEGGTLGILKLIGVSTAAAFAITLLIRVFTLGAGMLFGLSALLILHIKEKS